MVRSANQTFCSRSEQRLCGDAALRRTAGEEKTVSWVGCHFSFVSAYATGVPSEETSLLHPLATMDRRRAKVMVRRANVHSHFC